MDDEVGVADRHDVALGEDGVIDAGARDERAVDAAEVLDLEAGRPGAQGRVLAGGQDVVDDDGVVGGAADRHVAGAGRAAGPAPRPAGLAGPDRGQLVEQTPAAFAGRLGFGDGDPEVRSLGAVAEAGDDRAGHPDPLHPAAVDEEPVLAAGVDEIPAVLPLQERVFAGDHRVFEGDIHRSVAADVHRRSGVVAGAAAVPFEQNLRVPGVHVVHRLGLPSAVSARTDVRFSTAHRRFPTARRVARRGSFDLRFSHSGNAQARARMRTPRVCPVRFDTRLCGPRHY